MINLKGVRLFSGLAATVLFIQGPLFAEEGKVTVEQGNFKIEVSAPDTVKSDDAAEKDVLYLTKWPAEGEPEKEVTATVTPTIKAPADIFWRWHSTEPTPTKKKFKGEPDETFEITVTFWTYGMMDDGVTPDDTMELKATIRMPKVEFVELKGSDETDAGWNPVGTPPNLQYKFEVGGGKHKGSVKVNPKGMVDKFDIRLFQTKAGVVSSDADVGMDAGSPGEDTTYNADPNPSGPGKGWVEGEDKIVIQWWDYPGPQYGENKWRDTVPKGETDFKANFNLYIQYTTKGGSKWKTAGKMKWSTHRKLILGIKKTAVGNNQITEDLYKVGTIFAGAEFEDGTESKEEPENPAVPK